MVLDSEEYVVEVEFPVSVLFGVESSRYVAKIRISDSSTTLREVLKKLNDDVIKSERLEGYLEGGSGFYVFVNDNLVKDVDEAMRKLVESGTTNIKIRILPVFEGG